MHLRSCIRGLFVPVMALALLAPAARGGDAVPVTAARVSALAKESARAWADDARLIYLENDESVDVAGGATRWGYLYYSANRDAARAYSLESGKVRQATDLGFDFPAPPLAEDWIDSDRARAAAEGAGGRKYCEKHAGRLRTMLLVRGAFHDDDPDRTTWTLVYDSPAAPSLWIVVDAENGDVVKTWKG